MKKYIAAIALVAGLTMATAASANWGRGGHGYDGDGYCPQMQGQMMQGQMMPGQMMQQLDPAIQEKVSKFFKDNLGLHKQIAMKQAEKRAIMQSEKPDPQAAANVTGELFDLQTAMHDKAEAAGVSQYLGHKGGGKVGQGPGAGTGMKGPKQ